jgi:hypothetical protein
MNGHLTPEPRTSRHHAFAAGENPRGGNDPSQLSRRGLRDLLLFLAVSTLFFSIRHVDLLTPLAEPVRQLLGCPPPPFLTTLAVAGYTLSATILILGRIMKGDPPSCKWSHLFFRTIFYFFYAAANALPENFMGVFVAGLFLLTLEQLHIWTYGLKTQPEGKALFGKL